MTGELKDLLGEDGSRVYEEVEKALQGGNARTKSAASVGAAILAAHAATWAERVSRATGKPFTAQDYMKSVTIDADGTVQEGALNALRSGVDLDEEVAVADVSVAIPAGGANRRAVLAFIRQLAASGKRYKTTDNMAYISVLPKDVRHIAFSSHKNAKMRPEEHPVRIASIYALPDLLENAVLIESIPNQKKAKKPNVKAYHRFYVPIKTHTRIYTLRLVVEEQANGLVAFNPAELNLYDVIVERNQKKKVSHKTGIKPVNRGKRLSDTITICEMLAGVKDTDGKTYYQQHQESRGQIQGQFSVLQEGSRLVSLFEAADESTACFTASWRIA